MSKLTSAMKLPFALLVLIGGRGHGSSPPLPATAGTDATVVAHADASGNIPIKHFIYIIQENISFDHYFGTYPGAEGIPPGTKLPYRPGGEPSVAPFHLHETAIPHDLNHSWQAAHLAYNGGKMDGFIYAEWPRGLAFYWKGKLPEVDPEDIIPQDESAEMVKEDLANANEGRRRPAPGPQGTPAAENEAVNAGNMPEVGQGGVGIPPRTAAGLGSQYRLLLRLARNYPPTGSMPADSRSAIISSRRSRDPVNPITCTPSPPSPAVWSTTPAAASKVRRAFIHSRRWRNCCRIPANRGSITMKSPIPTSTRCGIRCRDSRRSRPTRS